MCVSVWLIHDLKILSPIFIAIWTPSSVQSVKSMGKTLGYLGNVTIIINKNIIVFHIESNKINDNNTARRKKSKIVLFSFVIRDLSEKIYICRSFVWSAKKRIMVTAFVYGLVCIKNLLVNCQLFLQLFKSQETKHF